MRNSTRYAIFSTICGILFVTGFWLVTHRPPMFVLIGWFSFTAIMWWIRRRREL